MTTTRVFVVVSTCFACAPFACTKPAGSVGTDSGVLASGSATAAASAAATDAVVAPPSPSGASSLPANGTPFPIASVLKTVNPDGLAAYRGPVGSVEGVVTVIGESAKRDTFAPSEAAKCKDTVASDVGLTFREDSLPDGKRGLRDVLVYAIKYEGFVPEQKPVRTVHLQECTYTERTVDVTYGQRIDVVNDDKTPYAPSLAGSPNPILNMVAPAHSVSLYPRELGPAALGVRIGPTWTRATVYTLPQPLHTVSKKGGEFRIDGIPAGTVVGLRFHHPAFPEEVGREVEIRAGVVVRVDAELSAR